MEWFTAIRRTLLPRDTNINGTIFGGVILSEIDLAGVVCATRYINTIAERNGWTLPGHKIVTKAIQEVIFHAPTFVGDLISFNARVTKVGRTSITTEIVVLAQSPIKIEEREVTTATVTYVAISNNSSTPIWNLEPKERDATKYPT